MAALLDLERSQRRAPTLRGGGTERGRTSTYQTRTHVRNSNQEESQNLRISGDALGADRDRCPGTWGRSLRRKRECEPARHLVCVLESRPSRRGPRVRTSGRGRGRGGGRSSRAVADGRSRLWGRGAGRSSASPVATTRWPASRSSPAQLSSGRGDVGPRPSNRSTSPDVVTVGASTPQGLPHRPRRRPLPARPWAPIALGARADVGQLLQESWEQPTRLRAHSGRRSAKRSRPGWSS